MILVNIAVIIIIILALLLWSIHACDAFALTTCWCALQSIFATGACFLITFAAAIASHYLEESLWCRWLSHFDRHKTRGRCFPTPRLRRYIITPPCLYLMISPMAMKSSCITCWWNFLWRHVLCSSSYLLHELCLPCRVEAW